MFEGTDDEYLSWIPFAVRMTTLTRINLYKSGRYLENAKNTPDVIDVFKN